MTSSPAEVAGPGPGAGTVVSGAMATVGSRPGRRLSAVLREGDRVTFLELFFDLVFDLAKSPSRGSLFPATRLHGPEAIAL